MNRYELKNALGDGTYGSVVKAIKKGTREVVAIKKMKKKYSSFTECLDLREVKTLRDLSHPHIVRLLEVIRENDSTLCFVFEHMDANLYEVMKQYQNSFNLQAMGGVAAAAASNLPAMSSTGLTIIPTSKIQSILYQMLQALSFMHSKGYFHRDIKPENLLMKGDVVKVADLGLAREILSLPPYTDYVSTRWYRAPEVLLRSPHYNAPIDIFAVGCILAELFSLQPLFPGSSELDQISRICGLLGGPNPLEWSEGATLVNTLNLRIGHQHVPTVAQTVVHASTTLDSRLLQNIPQMSQSPVALDFLKGLLILNPKHRLSAKESLNHPFFTLPADMMETSTPNMGLSNQAVLSNHQSLALGLNQMAVAQQQLQQNEQQHQIQQQQAQAQAQQDVAVALIANSLQQQQGQQPAMFQQQQQQSQQPALYQQQQHNPLEAFPPNQSLNHLGQLDNGSFNQFPQQVADTNNLPYMSHNDLALAAELGQQVNNAIHNNNIQQAAQQLQQQQAWQPQPQAPIPGTMMDAQHQLEMMQQNIMGAASDPAAALCSTTQQQADQYSFNAAAAAAGLSGGGGAAAGGAALLDRQSFGPGAALAQLALHQAQAYGRGSPHGFGTQKF